MLYFTFIFFQFEKFCEPILNLAGFYIEIISTDYEGHARKYVEDIPKLPNAILVAGGDGTLSETVTGLFRREDGEICPIGILPVGRTNSVARRLFALSERPTSNIEEVKILANAAISAVRGKIEKKDAMKIELINSEGDDQPQTRPVYAVGGLQWGAFRDILSKRDKYWYTNGLREYVAFLFNAFSDDITWNCKARLVYSDPCTGCKNCRSQADKPKHAKNTRWWAKFTPRAKPTAPVGIDYSKIINESCNDTHELEVDSTEFELVTRNLELEGSELPQLKVRLSGALQKGFGYTLDAWSRVKSHAKLPYVEHIIDAKSVEIIPETDKNKKENDNFYSIDNEDFEVKPIRVSVVPEALQVFVLRP